MMDEHDLLEAGGKPIAGEVPPPGEAGDIEAIVRFTEAKLRQSFADAAGRGGKAGVGGVAAIARRDAHAKGHGCVVAEVRVPDDLPPQLARGLFAEPRAFRAVIRFSNGSGEVEPDGKGDSRGMAIKVLDVETSPSRTQDFVLVNHPVFVIRTAADYLSLLSADPQWRFFAPSLLPPRLRLHELALTLAIQRKKVENPLSLRYWSMAPFLHGDDACKFSARPLDPPSAFAERSGDAFMGSNLSRHLAAQQARFELLVQLRTNPSRMPIEDPTVEWPESDQAFERVAEITIPKQALLDADVCERLSFTPWHSIPAHRPLGGMNRVRREVYAAISRLRHELNGAERREPTVGDVDFSPLDAADVVARPA